jgi:hypothetical protein
MRPPIPNINLSRRAKIALWVVAVLIVLIIVLVQLTGVYINWLWFGSLGRRSVYTTVFWTRVSLFFIFGVLMALIIGGNLVIAYLLSPPFRPMSAEQQNIERYRAFLEPRRILVLTVISLIALFAAGASAQGNWAIWQLFLHGGSFGVQDPQFHLDVSFYAWDYPAYRSMLGFGFTAIIFAIILSTIVHYLSGAIRLQTPGPKVTLAARRHLTVLVFVFVVLKAIAYWLDRYGLVFSDRSKFTGASYTDVHAVLPARTILFWIAIVIAAGLIASMWLRSTMLPAIAFVSMLVLSILISGIYPAILQQVSVKPNASSKEKPYIKRNIEATRDAYQIVNSADSSSGTVTYKTYPISSSSVDTAALDQHNATMDNIRLLDPNVLSETFIQQQAQQKNFYGFPNKLDVDRYQVNGQDNDYIVGVRELNQNRLADQQTNWINEHTNYTHGWGFVAAKANDNVTISNNYADGDIPAGGPLNKAYPLKVPQVYYGELLPDYAIVGGSGPAHEFDGDGTKKFTYSGGGGVSLTNFFTKLAFAVNYKQTNFLLNDAVRADGSKIIFNRDPRQIVQKIAPFLKIDGDPYPIVDDQGHIVWMVDGYTTMDDFPYAQRESLSSLTSDSLANSNRTAKQPNDQINYIRNSVKATVDAYTGQVTLYQWDTSDPVLKAWMQVFPGLVKSKADMPSNIAAHVRYPEDIFEVQRAMLQQYHVSDPVQFYNVSNKWTVPADPDPEATGNQPPYYVLADSQDGSGTPQAEFQLTSPMKVNNKSNLAAYITVDCGPQNYGKMTVLDNFGDVIIPGPEQIANSFQSTDVISAYITLQNQSQSRVTHGNLLTLPVGHTFLFVEPLYVQSSSATSYPFLRRVLVAYNDTNHIGFGTDLTDALSDITLGTTPGHTLNQNGTGQATPGPSQTPSPTPSKGSSSSPPPTKSGGKVTLNQVQQAEQELNDALGSGDASAQLAAYAKLNQLVAQYLKDNPGSSPPTSPATSASRSP